MFVRTSVTLFLDQLFFSNIVFGSAVIIKMTSEHNVIIIRTSENDIIILMSFEGNVIILGKALELK